MNQAKKRPDFVQNSAKMVTKIVMLYFAQYKYLYSKDLCVARFLFCRLLNPTQKNRRF
jgi:hypothetical protein